MTIAQEKQQRAVILDSLQANKIIQDLEAGDAAIKENKIFAKLDSTNAERIKLLQDGSNDLKNALGQKEKETAELYKLNSDKDAIINKQKNVNNFLKGFSLASIITAVLSFVL